MPDTPRDQWIRHGLALLEMSAGAVSMTPAPSRRAVHAFAEIAHGLGERTPGWLSPWPVVALETPDDERPLLAVSLARDGARLLVREATPEPGSLSVTVVLVYYLHLVHEHLRAGRVAARRPAGVVALSPGEQAEVAEAFAEVDRVLHGTAGRDRLATVWETLAAAP
jgi:hypothetical protein